KDGLIRQVGSPSEIYERPNSVFVAGFVGKVAFFPAVLESRERDGSCVCAIAGRKVKAAHAADGAQAGKDAVIMARPESLRLLAPGEGIAEGKVSAKVYLGSSVEVFVKTDYGEILVQVDDPSGKRIADEGEAVSVGFNEALVRVLPPGAD
ncbi:MAG TPA: TOBE domain-containing protein, partial [Rectinemataceae bacterium]